MGHIVNQPEGKQNEQLNDQNHNLLMPPAIEVLADFAPPSGLVSAEKGHGVVPPVVFGGVAFSQKTVE
jgi:hypothetical protein